MIELKKITWDDYKDLLRLQVKANQAEFVSSNAECLAKAYVSAVNDEYPKVAIGIYEGDKAIGMAMYGYYSAEDNHFDHEPCYIIDFIMIDRFSQGRGCGGVAAKKLLDHLLDKPMGEANYVYLQYHIDNTIARTMFRRFGFADIHVISEGKNVVRLKL